MSYSQPAYGQQPYPAQPAHGQPQQYQAQPQMAAGGGNRNSQNKPYDANGKREWTNGLCSCFGDCGTCECLDFFCTGPQCPHSRWRRGRGFPSSPTITRPLTSSPSFTAPPLIYSSFRRTPSTAEFKLKLTIYFLRLRCMLVPLHNLQLQQIPSSGSRNDRRSSS
jgi:hypothetical protein